MCLEVVYRGKQKREALAKLPDWFYVWKVLAINYSGNYFTPWSISAVYAGERKAEFLGHARAYPNASRPLRGGRAYESGWHANRTHSGLIVFKEKHDHNCYKTEDVRCKAKKKHIRAIGEQDGQLVVVLSRITFPKKCGKPPKKK